MPAEDDYGPTTTTTSSSRRQQLLLHHANSNSPSPVPSATTSAPPNLVVSVNGAATASSSANATASTASNCLNVTITSAVTCPAGCTITPDRLQANSQERLSERGSISSGSDRLHSCYAAASSTERLERFPDRFQASEKTESGSERLHERYTTDRLPADRYSTVATDRHLVTERLQTSGHCPPDRYRYAQSDYRHQNIGSLDRYGTLATDRYHAADERSSSSDRSLERYNITERFSNDRNSDVVYHTQPRNTQNTSANSQSYAERYSTNGRYHHQDRFQVPTQDYQQERFNCERDRYPTIPCPERFATQNGADRSFSSQERITFNQVPYIPPPSPAPASDRFIPPPPLSPTNTPSPDCYPSNPFPSPTTTAPTERFIPPPPLSPSPTEKFSPKPDRFATDKRYPDRYSVSPNPDKYQSGTNDRYGQYHMPEPRYQDRYQCYTPSDRYAQTQQYHQPDRYGTNERYLPPTAHTPVERYIPQPQEPYYQGYQTYERYPKWSQNNSGDPYMRRDLGYHHHYRLPVPFQHNHYQRMRYSHLGTPNRAKCCSQYQDGYQLSKSSPGSSSSSSSVTSQGKEIQTYVNQPKDLQCYHQSDLLQPGFHQEKAIQCANFQKDLQCVGFASPSVRVSKVPCKHICSSPSVEYVGQSGGRHISATPPPPRSASAGGESHCGDQCCLRRPATTLHSATIWRSSGSHHQQPSNPSPSPSPTVLPPAEEQQHVVQPPQQIAQISTQQPQQQSPPLQQQQQPQQQIPQQQIPQQQHQQQSQQQQIQQNVSSNIPESNVTPITMKTNSNTSVSPPTVQRAISLPAPSVTERYHQHHQQLTANPQMGSSNVGSTPRRIDYTQSERITNRERPKFARSASRKEAVKNFIKKETANFFGVDEETENDQQLRWLDRRKRLASRNSIQLKDEYVTSSIRHRRTLSPSYVQQSTSSPLASSSTDDGRGPSIGEPMSMGAPPPYPGDMPDVLPAPTDVADAGLVQERYPEVTVRRKESVARMTWDGISYVVNTLTKHRPRPRSQIQQWSRSYPPEDGPTEVLEDDVFFERPTTPASPNAPDAGDTADAPLDPRPPPARYSTRSGAPAWRRDTLTARRDQQRPEIGGSRIWSAMLDTVLDNSDRRQYGMGWVGKAFGRSVRSSVAQEERIQRQLDDLEDYRPFFTYWVTTVQVLILVISLICYGFGPPGIDLYQTSGQVLVTSLSLQQVEYMEPANFWLGPRAADLIHLGAKFAPCMRVDTKIMKEIDKMREKERETACCIRNDDSGCVQSSQADCSKTISTWKKWSAGDSGPGGRISGSVCGLDPKFCDAPASVHPYEWPDDITKWPICRKTNSFTQRRGNIGGNSAKSGSKSISTTARDKLAEHMVCEVIGHPCCIGIHGQCRITTKEYCDFVRGHFHEEASLCAQVSCLDDVCGMVPFYFMETPDQFYRLWTSLFLHAGIIQLLVSVAIQHFLMRDLEKLTGPFRIGIIYMGSGVAGNLASSIFVPYRADVGPAGAQFGLLACLVVEVINSWPMLKHPHYALFKLLSITFVLLLFGLLPWVDNYSHIFGFIFGFLLSYAFLPFVSFGPYDRQRKIVLIWVCLTSAGVLFICLILLFYIIPVYDCEICSYLNCLPLTRDFCASQNINFMKEEPVV